MSGLSVSVLTSGNAAAAASAATASVSPAPGSLVVVYVTWAVSGGTTSTPSGLGATWATQNSQATGGSSSTKIACYTAQMGTAPGSGAITFTFGAGSATCCWAVLQVTGHNTTTPVVQVPVVSKSTTSTAASLTYAAAKNPANLFLYGCAGPGFFTQVPNESPTLWTELTDNEQATPSCALETQVSPDVTNLTGSSTLSATSVDSCIGLELGAGAVPLVVPVPRLLPLLSPVGRPWVITSSATGPIAKTLTDAGAATDTLSVVVTGNTPVVLLVPPSLALASPAAPPRVILGQVAPIALADAGTGADALAIVSTVPLADTGAGTDALPVAVVSSMPVVVPVPPSQPYQGPAQRPQVIEQPPLAVTPVGLADAGTAADSLLAAITNMPVVVQGAPVLPLQFRPQQPQVVLGQVAPVALGDTGTGTDALAVTPAVPFADSGSGTDALSLTATSIPLVVQPPLLRPLSSPAGAPWVVTGQALSVQAIPLGDAGAGTDTLPVASGVPLADAGTGTDVPGVTVPVPLADLGHAADALAVQILAALADSGAGADVAAVTAAVLLADAGAGLDAAAAASGFAGPVNALSSPAVAAGRASLVTVGASGGSVPAVSGRPGATAVTAARGSSAAVTQGAGSSPAVSDG